MIGIGLSLTVTSPSSVNAGDNFHILVNFTTSGASYSTLSWAYGIDNRTCIDNCSFDYSLTAPARYGDTLAFNIVTPTDNYDNNIYIRSRATGTLTSVYQQYLTIPSGGLNISVPINFSTNHPITNLSISTTIFGTTYLTNYTSTSIHLQISQTTSSGIFIIPITASWVNEDGTLGTTTATYTLMLGNTYSFNLSCTNTTMLLAVNSNATAQCNMTSNGNSQIPISFNIYGEPLTTAPDSFTLQPAESKLFNLTFSVPYTWRSNGIVSLIAIGSSVQQIDFNISITQPAYSLIWNSTDRDMNATNFILNAQVSTTDSLQGLSYSLICPTGWSCQASGPATLSNSTSLIPINVTLINPLPGEETIILIVNDSGGRNLNLSYATSVIGNLTTPMMPYFKVYVIENVEVADDAYYLVGANGLYLQKDLNTSMALGRVSRNSSLSTWRVKLGDNSIGIGTICQPFLIVDNIKYSLSNTTWQALSGPEGVVAYESYKFMAPGECVVNLDFDGVQTITDVVVMGNVPETVGFTKDDVQILIDQVTVGAEQAKQDQYRIFAFIFAIMVGVFSIVIVGRDRLKKYFYEDKHPTMRMEVDRFAEKLTEMERKAEKKLEQFEDKAKKEIAHIEEEIKEIPNELDEFGRDSK